MNETSEPAGIGVLIDSDDPVHRARVCHRQTRAPDGLLIEDERIIRWLSFCIMGHGLPLPDGRETGLKRCRR